MQLTHYSAQINLFEHWLAKDQGTFDLDWIIEKMSTDSIMSGYIQGRPSVTDSVEQKEKWIKAMLTVRSAGYVDEHLFTVIDNWIAHKNSAKPQFHVSDLKADALHDCGTELITWQGDITTIQADAIVNAANSQMQGCFQPFHACIDNAIHTAAGPRLREDCHTIIQIQGEDEMTGTAKITRGYNLPSRFVLHTVGPIVHQGDLLTNGDRQALAGCYTSCLDLAKEHGDIKSIVFCAISTGVFGFPKQEAAPIAVEAVSTWLSRNNHNFKYIVFNTFDEHTTALYKRELTV